MADPIIPERLVRLSPLVRRITQDNPGIMTGPGTNTYLVGLDEVLVIDPGQNTDEHFHCLLQAIGGASVSGVAVTHAHPDHWPLAPRLAAALGVQTFGFHAHGGFQPDRVLADANLIRAPVWTVEAMHTPGHSGDHLCYFLREENALFTGDHVMGWSTSVILRPDGSLRDYMRSLERTAAKGATIIYPGHGEPVTDPGARIAELAAHRNERTAQIREAIASGATTIDAIVARVYPGIDPRLRPFARSSVEAHLDELEPENRDRPGCHD